MYSEMFAKTSSGQKTIKLTGVKLIEIHTRKISDKVAFEYRLKELLYLTMLSLCHRLNQILHEVDLFRA